MCWRTQTGSIDELAPVEWILTKENATQKATDEMNNPPHFSIPGTTMRCDLFLKPVLIKSHYAKYGYVCCISL